MKMEDIAMRAGVSKSAVSLAFSGKPGISQKTRERILQIARESGYTPKTRTTSAGKSARTIRFLIFSNSGIVLEQYYAQPFFRELIHHIEERCRANGYSLLFSAVDMQTFDRDVRTVADDDRSDGVILLGTNLSRSMIAALAAELPSLVVLDTCFDTLPVRFVQINNRLGAYQAGSYLCGLGHHDIGYVASSVRIHNFDERREGFLAALGEHGRHMADDRFFTAAPTILAPQDALKEQFAARLAQGRLPSALFCECDYIAISVMKTLAEIGARVPDDVSVIGFDNISEAVIVSPELTTVHVEKETMARLAVDLLIETIEDKSDVVTKTFVDTRLVERGSCAPAGKPAEAEAAGPAG